MTGARAAELVTEFRDGEVLGEGEFNILLIASRASAAIAALRDLVVETCDKGRGGFDMRIFVSSIMV
jgi:hypothetical protein